MDKNIAAFLDQSAYTILVQFQAEQGARGSNYKYVTNLPGLAVGDWLVVPVTSNRQQVPLRSPVSAKMQTVDDVMDMVTYAEDEDAPVHAGTFECVRVVAIHDTVDIEPNAPKEYKWVVCKLDLEAYGALFVRNKKIASATTAAYRKSMQRSFADRILGDMDAEAKDNLLKLLGK